MPNQTSVDEERDARAQRFIAFAKKEGIDARMSQDGTRIEFFSKVTGRKLCSSPIDDFSSR